MGRFDCKHNIYLPIPENISFQRIHVLSVACYNQQSPLSPFFLSKDFFFFSYWLICVLFLFHRMIQKLSLFQTRTQTSVFPTAPLQVCVIVLFHVVSSSIHPPVRRKNRRVGLFSHKKKFTFCSLQFKALLSMSCVSGSVWIKLSCSKFN